MCGEGSRSRRGVCLCVGDLEVFFFFFFSARHAHPITHDESQRPGPRASEDRLKLGSWKSVARNLDLVAKFKTTRRDSFEGCGSGSLG